MAKIREDNMPDEAGNRPGMELAFDKSIAEMPRDFLIREYIMANRAEVKDMCLTGYNEAEAMELFKEEGREEGEENATISYLKNLMNNLKLTIEQAMDAIRVPEGKRAYYKGLIDPAVR